MEEKRHRHNCVGGQELDALEPIALAILHDEIDHEDREYDGDELERVEDKIHGVRQEQAREHEERRYHERDLGRRADRDLE